MVYPFAEPAFAGQPRHDPSPGPTRILYAGRLSPEKGIYTFLSMLHVDVIADDEDLSGDVPKKSRVSQSYSTDTRRWDSP